MKQEIKTKKMSELLELKRHNMLSANPEYQRGAVWGPTQKKKLIDSVLRGYPLPMFYFHHKNETFAGYQNDKLDIIDGQQRINALFEFREGSYKLFDPKLDDKTARFPKFIINSPCPWAGCSYEELDEEQKRKFDDTDLFVVNIETDNDDESRDLFIRLQAGLPLNAQEKRDAWPGGYTEFVLKFAGKKEITRYPGDEFFQKYVKASSSDRGATRQLCAQIGMLFFESATQGNWLDIKTGQVDNYYYQNLDFDLTSQKVMRFKKVLELAKKCFNNYNGKKLLSHETIHVLLLIDSLMDDYTPSWIYEFTKALDKFRESIAEAQKVKEGEYWDGYANWIRTGSDQSATIRKMHLFFTEKMISLLKPVQKDKERGFGQLEREIIYYRYDKKCPICKHEIIWDDLDIHHVIEHQHGGKTSINNAVPVHKLCHPKGKLAEEFAKTFVPFETNFHKDFEGSITKKSQRFDLSKLPDGTKCKWDFKNRTYNGMIKDGLLVVENLGEFISFTAASKEISNTARSGLKDWKIYYQEKDMWIKAEMWLDIFSE